MLKPEILEYICQNQLYEYCSFVTDDTMADVLYEQGPLNAVVQKAIDMGFRWNRQSTVATYTPCPADVILLTEELSHRETCGLYAA